MGICRQAISKYITGPNQQIQLPVNIREPTRHIATVEVMTALEYFKTKKPSTTYHEIQQNISFEYHMNWFLLEFVSIFCM
jgi:hypothetical protein